MRRDKFSGFGAPTRRLRSSPATWRVSRRNTATSDSLLLRLHPRSFSVLEGIGLTSDKDYSIANGEVLPCVARGSSPTTPRRRAGSSSSSCTAKTVPRPARETSSSSPTFGNYSSITNVRESPKEAVDGKPASAGLSQGTKEALRLAFTPEGSPAQDILLRELARFTGAAASSAVNSAASAPALGFLVGLAEAQQRAAEALGPARPPLPTAIELLAPLTRRDRRRRTARPFAWPPSSRNS